MNVYELKSYKINFKVPQIHTHLISNPHRIVCHPILELLTIPFLVSYFAPHSISSSQFSIPTSLQTSVLLTFPLIQLIQKTLISRYLKYHKSIPNLARILNKLLTIPFLISYFPPHSISSSQFSIPPLSRPPFLLTFLHIPFGTLETVFVKVFNAFYGANNLSFNCCAAHSITLQTLHGLPSFPSIFALTALLRSLGLPCGSLNSIPTLFRGCACGSPCGSHSECVGSLHLSLLKKRKDERKPIQARK